MDASVDYAQRYAPVVVLHVALGGFHVDHRRQASAVTGGEAALVKVQVVHHVGVEAREKPSEVANVVQGHSVEQEEVVVAVASVHVQARHQLVAYRHAGQQLQLLDKVGSAEYRDTSPKFFAVDVHKTRLSGVAHLFADGGDVGSVEGVAFLDFLRIHACGRRYGGRERYDYVFTVQHYLLTWKRVLPVAKKSAIWRAAASPALMLASAVCAPIFLGVANTRAPNFSCRTA